MFRLIVKGGTFKATFSAMWRGIPAAVLSNASKSFQDCTFLLVSRDHEKKVLDWFHEHASIEPGKGFPEGTLMFYGNAVESTERIAPIEFLSKPA